MKDSSHRPRYENFSSYDFDAEEWDCTQVDEDFVLQQLLLQTSDDSAVPPPDPVEELPSKASSSICRDGNLPLTSSVPRSVAGSAGPLSFVCPGPAPSSSRHGDDTSARTSSPIPAEGSRDSPSKVAFLPPDGPPRTLREEPGPPQGTRMATPRLVFSQSPCLGCSSGNSWDETMRRTSHISWVKRGFLQGGGLSVHSLEVRDQEDIELLRERCTGRTRRRPVCCRKVQHFTQR